MNSLLQVFLGKTFRAANNNGASARIEGRRVHVPNIVHLT